MTLIHRLEQTFGISSVALDWILSYLSGRSQFVRLGNCTSAPHPCPSGVPQGSVLGPLLFTLYISPVANVISSFGISHHQYADDTQLYSAIDRASFTQATVLDRCATAVHRWFILNGLALNPNKSEVIPFGTASSVSALQAAVPTVTVAGSSIGLAGQVKNLGIILDSHLSFNSHVNSLCKAAYYHIRALRHVRPCLSQSLANTVACAIIGAKLDYCNSLLYGTSAANLVKLQRIQNSLARVVTGTRKYDHITPALINLHWLPVRERITFKVATLAFKTIQSGQPPYLASLVQLYHPTRQLRSASEVRLQPLELRLARKAITTRAFSAAAPTVWNDLPTDIRALVTTSSLATFRKHLKKHLFERSYPPRR